MSCHVRHTMTEITSALQSGLLLVPAVHAAADQPFQCHCSCAQQALTASCWQVMLRKLLPQQSSPPALQSELLLIAAVHAAADQPFQCHCSCAPQAQHALTASCLQVMLRKLLPQQSGTACTSSHQQSAPAMCLLHCMQRCDSVLLCMLQLVNDPFYSFWLPACAGSAWIRSCVDQLCCCLSAFMPAEGYYTLLPQIGCKIPV